MDQSSGGRVTRRALLGTAAAGLVVAGCSSGPARPTVPKPPDPQTMLLVSLIGAKEQQAELYQRAAASEAKLATELEAFRQRHVAHLAALRKLLPRDAGPRDAGPVASPGSPVSLARLRDAERRAAAGRPAQMARVSPLLAQLLASIGACEAVHVVALGRLHD